MLENEAYYNHGSAWGTKGSNFSKTIDHDRSRRKAQSVLRTIPDKYEEEMKPKPFAATRNSEIKHAFSNSFFSPYEKPFTERKLSNLNAEKIVMLPTDYQKEQHLLRLD